MMPRILGGVLLALCASCAGFLARRRLGERTALLTELRGAIAGLEREMSFCLTPMPELLYRAAGQCSGAAARFFSVCMDGVCAGQGGLLPIWTAAVEAELAGLKMEERRILHELGAVLGRYSGEEQRAALQSAEAQLEGYIASAREEQGRLGRVYSSLGLAAGAFFLILIV